jgi:hypothetical protein
MQRQSQVRRRPSYLVRPRQHGDAQLGERGFIIRAARFTTFIVGGSFRHHSLGDRWMGCRDAFFAPSVVGRGSRGLPLRFSIR